MPSRLDELLRDVSSTKAKVEVLEERAKEDRAEADAMRREMREEYRRQDDVAAQRHTENQAAIAALRVHVIDTIEDLSKKIQTHADLISKLQGSWSKLAMYAAIGMAGLAFAGFLLESAVKAAFAWLVTKIGG